MRILGFSQHWGKLSRDEFTTFRYPRADRDWYLGEAVKVVIQPRRKGGGCYLGTSEIISKESKLLEQVTQQEAIADGFTGWIDMFNWLRKSYDVERLQAEPMNKLTLRWLNANT